MGILPDIAMLKFDAHIPRRYLVVERIDSWEPSDPSKLLATASVAFAASYSSYDEGDEAYFRGGFETRLKKAWCFASFRPGSKLDLRRATMWMQAFIKDHSSIRANAPPVLSDFDEHVKHFDLPTEFTLSDLFARSLDIGRVDAYARYLRITLNINGSTVGAIAVGKDAVARGAIAVQDDRFATLPSVQSIAGSDGSHAPRQTRRDSSPKVPAARSSSRRKP